MLQRYIQKIGRFCVRKAPTILTIVGAGGVVATTVMAVKATPEAVQLISYEEKRQWNNPDFNELTKLEKLKLCWPIYIPTAIVGLSTITCIVGANILNQRQQASIISLYGLMDQSYKRYRIAAGEVYGDDANERINAQVAKDTYVSNGGYKVYSPDLDDSERVLFYDIFSGRYFESTLAAVINAQYHLNRNWVLKGEVTMNEFYVNLGVDEIAGGDDVGWDYDYAEEGLAWIDFDISKTSIEDGLECFVISTPFGPDPLSWVMADAEKDYNI